MKIHNVAQGSPEWHALRANYHTASEAPAMMGASKQLKRTELLHAKKTDLDRDASWWVQKYLFDKGHEAEASARPILEARLDEDLFPIVGTEGDLLASLDGCTMLGEILFEHKMWNEQLAADVRAGELDAHYYWQLEQQLLVAGAENSSSSAPTVPNRTSSRWSTSPCPAVPRSWLPAGSSLKQI